MDKSKKLLSIIAMLLIIVGSIVYYEMTKQEHLKHMIVVESYETDDLNMKNKL
ncbi:hypothetical protein [Macrococcus animalis]|uniref:hypothetical protein n=1 Tax=Macrococcus animalis TaxID=3395467 RepID=UPI0039BDC89E